MMGELFHTDSAHLDSTKVSHIVTSLTKRPNGYWGKGRILESGGGLVARDLLSKGAHLGWSSKGSGTTVQRGNTAFVESYALHQIDLVPNPSVGTEATAPAIVESLQETQAQDSVAGNSLKNFKQKYITNADVRAIVASVGKPELLAAFDAHCVDFDNTYGSVFNPHMTG